MKLAMLRTTVGSAVGAGAGASTPPPPKLGEGTTPIMIIIPSRRPIQSSLGPRYIEPLFHDIMHPAKGCRRFNLVGLHGNVLPRLPLWSLCQVTYALHSIFHLILVFAFEFVASHIRFKIQVYRTGKTSWNSGLLLLIPVDS